MKLPDDAVAQAIALRREGKTYRQIAEKLGWGKSAIHDALKSVPDAAPPAAPFTPEDREFIDDVDAVIEDALIVARGVIRDVGRRLQEASADPKKARSVRVSARDLTALKGTIIDLRALSDTVRARAPTAPPAAPRPGGPIQHTDAEARALAALDRLRKRKQEGEGL